MLLCYSFQLQAEVRGREGYDISICLRAASPADWSLNPAGIAPDRQDELIKQTNKKEIALQCSLE